jgi:hypothetical protein
MLGYGTIEPLLVSNSSVNTFRRPIRTLLRSFRGIAIVLLLAATVDQIQQRLLRYRAERLLSDMQTMALRQTEAQAYPAERIFDRFLQLVGDGALLTPEGWKEAEELSDESSEFSNENPIVLMSAAPENTNERSVKEDQVEVDAYWSNDIGSIDSAFRYTPPKPKSIHAVETVYRFHLLFTSTHAGIKENEHKTQEATGVRQWKLEGPFKRWATVEKTITYLTEKSGHTSDTETETNIKKTIATLRRINRPRANACAC